MYTTRTIDRAERPDTWHTREETRGKWYATMDRRLKLDRALTSRKLGEKALSRRTVEATWRGVTNAAPDNQEHWMRHAGVLVGRLDEMRNR